MTRWFFSQTYTCPELGHIFPICRAYGHSWMIPQHPQAANGWALVQMACGQHQIDAARQDHRVMVLPPLFDPTPLPADVIGAYANMGAVMGMSLAQLLGKLSEKEPRFALEMRT